MSQRYIHTRIWEDNYIFELDPSEKLVFLYLLTNDQANIAGVYEINLKLAAMETGLHLDQLTKIIDRFTADDKVYYVEGHIIIRNFIRYQATNPKVLLGINRVIEQLPERVRKLYLIDDTGLYLDAREVGGKDGGKLSLLTDKIDTMWVNMNKKDNSRNDANSTTDYRGRHVK